MELRFRDHASFHRAALGMTAGAALFGLALHVAGGFGAHAARLALVAPVAGGLVGVGVGAALAYGSAAWRVGLAILAAAIAVAAPSWQGLAAAGAFTAVAIAIPGRAEGAIAARRVRALLVMAFASALAVLAMWTALRVAHADRVATWPSWAADLAGASALGIVAALAVLPRHLALAADPIRAAIRALPSDLDAEVRALCGRAVAVHAKLDERDPDHDLARDGVLDALAVARQCAELRAATGTQDDLARRIADLDARIAAATDAEVKSQYESARAALVEQRRHRDDARARRERLVAKLHFQVATLEQLATAGALAPASAS